VPLARGTERGTELVVHGGDAKATLERIDLPRKYREGTGKVQGRYREGTGKATLERIELPRKRPPSYIHLAE
jgi:hypothetical protein